MVTDIFIQSFFQIIDEKSLIKKYQKEISTLKQELDQLKKGMLVAVNPEELMTLRQKVFLQILVVYNVIAISLVCLALKPKLLLHI